jgi:hypothetical protein
MECCSERQGGLGRIFREPSCVFEQREKQEPWSKQGYEQKRPVGERQRGLLEEEVSWQQWKQEEERLLAKGSGECR